LTAGSPAQDEGAGSRQEDDGREFFAKSSYSWYNKAKCGKYSAIILVEVRTGEKRSPSRVLRRDDFVRVWRQDSDALDEERYHD
jgi:hypothetical protein